MALLLGCSFEGSGNFVQVLDPKSGKAAWHYKMDDLSLMSLMLSADPLVVRQEDGDKSTFLVLDDRGGKRSEFTTGKVDMLAMNTVASWTGCSSSAATGFVRSAPAFRPGVKRTVPRSPAGTDAASPRTGADDAGADDAGAETLEDTPR
ncbi:hypothetical protein ACQPZZ_09095 [Microbispora sp. CA-135349]|uniref:hypothetical protein n=1 Tax=Microbispora sp. CA-135349 TaxID=3239953 RepID=UPI003D8CDEE1